MESARRTFSAAWGFCLLLAVLLLGAGAKSILYDTLDPDVFWHLRVADELAAQAYPHPLVDDLSFASVKSPWTPYSWLADLGMKRLWDAGGYRAAVLMQSLTSAALVFFIALTALEMSVAGHGRPRYLAAGISAFSGEFLCLPYLSFRPVTLALLLLAVAAWLLQRDRRLGGKSRAVWLVIPLTALLINIHLYAVFVPAAVAGLLFGAWRFRAHSRLLIPSPCAQGEGEGEGFCSASDSKRPVQSKGDPHPNPLPECRERGFWRYALLLIGTTGACLMTPFLPGIVSTAWHYQFDDVMVSHAMIAEMRPFYAGTLGPIAAGLTALVLVAAILHRRALRPGEWCWLIGSLLVMLRLGRFAPIFAIFGAPTLAVSAGGLSDAVLVRRPVRALLALLLVMGAARVGSAFPTASTSMSDWLNRLKIADIGYPAAAADFLQGHVPPRSHRVITEFNWGGYMEWRLGGNWRVLMDGRTQLFPAEFWETIYLSNPSRRQAFLRTLDADAAIVPVAGSIFKNDLLALGWKIIFADDRALVLVPAAGATSSPHSAQCTAAPDNAS